MSVYRIILSFFLVSFLPNAAGGVCSPHMVPPARVQIESRSGTAFICGYPEFLSIPNGIIPEGVNEDGSIDYCVFGNRYKTRINRGFQDYSSNLPGVARERLNSSMYRRYVHVVDDSQCVVEEFCPGAGSSAGHEGTESDDWTINQNCVMEGTWCSFGGECGDYSTMNWNIYYLPDDSISLTTRRGESSFGSEYESGEYASSIELKDKISPYDALAGGEEGNQNSAYLLWFSGVYPSQHVDFEG